MEVLQGFFDALQGIWTSSGFLGNDPRNYIMILISLVLLYLAIKKEFEPLLLLPIAFGMLLVNVFPGITATPSTEMQLVTDYMAAHNGAAGNYPTVILEGLEYYQIPTNGGLLYYLYQGVKLGIYPPLIFLGIGAMTDFGPLIANPKSFLLGAAAQLGIFVTFIGAMALGIFTAQEAGSIAIIGGADGPTAIYVTTILAPHLLGPIAVAAYSYMALVPIIQPPIMKVLTTKKERMIVMEQLRPVSKLEKILFPIIVTILISLLLPDGSEKGWVRISDLRYTANCANKKILFQPYAAEDGGMADPNYLASECIRYSGTQYSIDADYARENFAKYSIESLREKRHQGLRQAEAYDAARVPGPNSVDEYTKGQYCLENTFCYDYNTI